MLALSAFACRRRRPRPDRRFETVPVLRPMALLARDDRGQLFENLLGMRVAVCAESFAGIAKGVPPELVAETMRATKVVETIASAFASRQKMVYSSLQVRMVGEWQSTDPTRRINGFEYFLLASNRQAYFIFSLEEFCSTAVAAFLSGIGARERSITSTRINRLRGPAPPRKRDRPRGWASIHTHPSPPQGSALYPRPSRARSSRQSGGVSRCSVRLS